LDTYTSRFNSYTIFTRIAIDNKPLPQKNNLEAVSSNFSQVEEPWFMPEETKRFGGYTGPASCARPDACPPGTGCPAEDQAPKP
jgi:hypothetical protein